MVEVRLDSASEHPFETSDTALTLDGKIPLAQIWPKPDQMWAKRGPQQGCMSAKELLGQKKQSRGSSLKWLTSTPAARSSWFVF